MAESSALTIENARAIGLPTGTEWKAMLTMGGDLAGTGFLPTHIKNGAQAAAIMLKGQELRVPPMQALANIVMVQGKPTVSSELMLAIIYRDHGKQALRVKETTAERCTVEYRVEGWEGTQTLTFTIEDARQAGLVKQGPWTNYPAVMLRWRAISQVAKMAFPETIGGMYTPGELGEKVIVEGENIISAPDAIETTGHVSAAPTPISQAERRVDPRPTSEDPYRMNALRRVHAVGSARGINHDLLHDYVVTTGKTSLTDLSNAELIQLAAEIDTEDILPLTAMFGPLGWTAPEWMHHRTVDQETGEIIDVTPAPSQPSDDERKAAKAALWESAKGWGWTQDDLACVAEYTCEAPLSQLPTEQYRAIRDALTDSTPAEREAELRSAREALGRVA